MEVQAQNLVLTTQQQLHRVRKVLPNQSLVSTLPERGLQLKSPSDPQVQQVRRWGNNLT